MAATFTKCQFCAREFSVAYQNTVVGAQTSQQHGVQSLVTDDRGGLGKVSGTRQEVSD